MGDWTEEEEEKLDSWSQQAELPLLQVAVVVDGAPYLRSSCAPQFQEIDSASL
jgi:hypothetical protein